jgi:triacylglycerol esterase/lipase EstA (alpha/beta hydrolase family)
MKPSLQALAAWLLGACVCASHAQTSSPFPPPSEDMGKYVKNSGGGLDTGCTYRGGGPLIVQFKVPAPVNDTMLDGNGYILQDKLGKLIADKVVGARAKISFPVYDIDDKAVTDGTYEPEIDRLSWNGDFIKTLSGFNNTWVNDSFEIDIAKVKFAGREKAVDAVNEFRVDIDTANSDEVWCMSIDWVGIEFDAAFPYVLAHGIASNRDTWLDKDSPGVLKTMDEAGVVYERFSTANPNGAVGTNAANLRGQIQAYLSPYKAKKVNLIAHSKGGLDSQALAAAAPPFEVLSLGTLSTPHWGSVVADLTLLQRQVADIYTRQGGASNDFAQQFVSSTVAGLFSNTGAGGPQPPGLNDLTSWAAIDARNAGLRGNVNNTFTFGADAGPQCSGPPTDAQIDPMNPASSVPLLGGYVYNRLRMAYQSICTYASATQVQLEMIQTFDPNRPFITVLTYAVTAAPGPNPNDVVVGITSANPGWGTPLGNNANTNHTTVKNADNVRKILDKTISLR